MILVKYYNIPKTPYWAIKIVDEVCNVSSFIFLFDLDFDSIPEVFELNTRTNGNIMTHGFCYNGATIVEIYNAFHDNNYDISEFHLINTKNGKLEWISEYFGIAVGGSFIRQYGFIHLDNYELKFNEILYIQANPEYPDESILRLYGEDISLYNKNKYLIANSYYFDANSSYIDKIIKETIFSIGDIISYNSIVINMYEKSKDTILKEIIEWYNTWQ